MAREIGEVGRLAYVADSLTEYVNTLQLSF